MKSRKLCSKCQLTIFAYSEERLVKIASRVKCNCDKPSDNLPQQIKEYVGSRKIKISTDNFWLIKHLYE